MIFYATKQEKPYGFRGLMEPGAKPVDCPGTCRSGCDTGKNTGKGFRNHAAARRYQQDFAGHVKASSPNPIFSSPRAEV
jgi:hypothetical protein